MNSTITDQRYQIEKATCALTFDHIRLRRAMTLLPARQATASSGSQSPMQRERAMRYFPFTDDLGVTVKPPKRVAGRCALGSITIQRLPIEPSWRFWYFVNGPPTRTGACARRMPPECSRAIGRHRACGPPKPGPRRTAGIRGQVAVGQRRAPLAMRLCSGPGSRSAHADAGAALVVIAIQRDGSAAADRGPERYTRAHPPTAGESHRHREGAPTAGIKDLDRRHRRKLNSHLWSSASDSAAQLASR